MVCIKYARVYKTALKFAYRAFAEISEDELGSGEEPGGEGEPTPKRRKKDIGADRDEAGHSRRLSKAASRNSKFVQMKLTFGVGSPDLLPMIHTRENWGGAWDVTFPSSQSIKQSISGSSYGSGATFGVERDLLEREFSKGWDWYYSDTAGTAFRKQQRFERIGKNAGQRYLPRDKDTEHTVLIGPTEGQKAYKLRRGEVLDFGDGWKDKVTQAKKKRRPKKSRDTTVEEPGVDGSNRSDTRVPEREGWILSLGNNIQALSWAPNCNGEQYLAVSVGIPDEQRDDLSNPTGPTTPAFTPSLPYPAAIQIWSFESREVNDVRKLDMNVEPRLRLVLCSDSGDISHVCWCPMARERRPTDDSENAFNLGLLAGVWGDGTVKVLDISVNKKAGGIEWST